MCNISVSIVSDYGIINDMQKQAAAAKLRPVVKRQRLASAGVASLMKQACGARGSAGLLARRIIIQPVFSSIIQCYSMFSILWLL